MIHRYSLSHQNNGLPPPLPSYQFVFFKREENHLAFVPLIPGAPHFSPHIVHMQARYLTPPPLTHRLQSVRSVSRPTQPKIEGWHPPAASHAAARPAPPARAGCRSSIRIPAAVAGRWPRPAAYAGHPPGWMPAGETRSARLHVLVANRIQVYDKMKVVSTHYYKRKVLAGKT